MNVLPTRRLDQPGDLRIIAALEAVGAGRSTVQLPTMSASFRDELRTQLVAVAPRLVAEGVRPGTETAARPAASTRRSASTAKTPAPTRARTRPMTVLVAGAAVVVLGLGGATWLARGALPGDALYGLKRTAEGVDVSLSGSQYDKGKTLLLGATRRVQEVSALVNRPQAMALGTGSTASGGLSESTVKLIVSTLDTADTDTQKGVTLIGEDYVSTGSTAGLTLVNGWAGGADGTGGQIALIGSLITAVPAEGDAHDRAEASLTNIQKAWKRSVALLAQVGTTCTSRPPADEFGPVPCAAPTSAPTTSTPASKAPSSGATTSNPGGGATTASTSGSAPTTSQPTSSASAPSTSGRTTPAAKATTPAVAVGTCGVQIGLPVATVSLGTCTPTP